VTAVVVERLVFAIGDARRRAFEAKYVPLVAQALGGDLGARRMLVACPRRDRVAVAELLIAPLVHDRAPARIAAARAILFGMAMEPYADVLLRSRLWWRRALAMRAVGLLQLRTHTAALVAGLDDWRSGVRAAALDGLADMRDPASLPAIVVRLHDTTLHRGRRVAALAAFGAEAEPLLLDFAEVDAGHRARYAAALAMCGTAASRPVLNRWAADAQPQTRAAAFRALKHVGLDAAAAQLAIAALEDIDPDVRAAAAAALEGWTGPGEAAVHLSRHLDDVWPVASKAARSLQAIGPSGVVELTLAAARTDLAGLLARQMLWETQRS
jgi:HEAT repeat protein